MKESTIKLLSMDQQIYLEKILKSRELFKSRGNKFVSVEKSMISDNYGVYLLGHLERSIFDGELVEYIEL